MNLFYSITLYLWDYIFSIIDKNEIKLLRIVCKDFRNISTNYWFQNIPYKENNNYLIFNQKFNLNIRFIILQNKRFDIKNSNQIDLLLFISCKNGYLELVKLLIKNNVNINQKDNFEYTALMYATINGHLEIVKLLLENGVNVNEKNNYEYTVLMYATLYAKLEIIKLLIKNGVNINQKNNCGLSSLILASENGHLEIVKLLIDNGANINQKDNNERNALQYAKKNNQIKIIKYLENFI